MQEYLVEMLLGFIAGYLNQYIGAYFENIDVSQLTGSVFSGGVTLKDIKLRKTIFESLGLPFHVVAGKCGSLEIQYSLYRLYSEPVVVKVKDLFAIVVPACGVKYDAKADKAAMQAEKLRQLDVFETMKLHMSETQAQGASGANDAADLAQGNHSATYLDVWVMQILRNIQFHIESVHIRYEDDLTKKSEPFAVGVTVREINILTTDSEWHSQYIKDHVPETIFKLTKVDGLTVYWNPAPTVMYKGVSDQKMLFERLSALPGPRNQDPAFKTLFGPLTLEVKVQITVFPDTMKIPFSKPKIRVDTNLSEQLLCTVSVKQIRDIIPFAETLEFLTKSLQYRKFRPELPGNSYRGHYKEWWHFAYECVMEDITRRRNNFRWAVISEHRDKCQQYLKAYYKKMVQKKNRVELDQIIDKMEEELDLFNLILLRKHVELIEARQIRNQQQIEIELQQGYVNHAINWVWSWWSTPPPPPTPNAAAPQMDLTRRESRKSVYSPFSLSPKDKEDLWVAVGFAKNIDLINYPEDYIDIEINAMLSRLRIQLYKVQKNQRVTILDALLDNVSFSLHTRPVSDGLVLEVKLGKIEAFGGDFPSTAPSRTNFFTSRSPQILTTANPEIQEYFLKLLYEKCPLNSEVDHKLSLEGMALQLIYHEEAIKRLIDFFNVPRAGGPIVPGPIPATKVIKQLINFKNYPTNKLLRIMENKGKMELNVCLISHYLVFPQDDSGRRRSSFFVVQLGEINLVGTIVGGTICEHGGCSTF